MAIGSAIGAVLAARVADDVDAAAGRHPAQLRRRRRRAGRLGGTSIRTRGAHRHRGARSTRSRSSSASSSARSPSPARSIAFGKLQGVIRSKPLLLPGRHLLNLAMLLACRVLRRRSSSGRIRRCWPLLIDDARRRHPRHPPGHGDRRRRHAGGRLDAEQLLGLGRGGRRLHAVERPADHHRRPGRLERRDPELHHVPGDEPLVPERDLRRLRRRRGRRPGQERQRRAAGRGEERDRGRDRGDPAGRQERRDRPRLRHGRRAGAVPALRGRPSCSATPAPTCASPSTRWPAACPAT